MSSSRDKEAMQVCIASARSNFGDKVCDETKLKELLSEGSLGFHDWTLLISEIEKQFPDDAEKITLAYDSFLLRFPLCHGYWRKYAAHMAHLCTIDSVIKVFERAVQSATYSVDIWFDYCSFGTSVFDDPVDVRRLFKRGMSFVGKDYLCHTLWDKFIEFEFQQQQWSSLAHLYIQVLRFPTKKLHYYYDSFRQFTDICKEEMGCQNDSTLEMSSICDDVVSSYSKDEISLIIKDLQDQPCSISNYKTLQKYLYIGDRFYQESCLLNTKIECFEASIQRTYFHVEPVDSVELENWHLYLDFVETQEDFDWTVKLYERCLIPCANYPEFWIRYTEYMERKGGREIAIYALDRATQIFLRSTAVIHLFNACFKEKIKDLVGARAAFSHLNADSDSNFVTNVIKEANMERRLGNFGAACCTYEVAIKVAVDKKKLQMLPNLYIHYSRLKYKICSMDAARDVLLEGTKHVPHCKLLLEELIKFSLLHGDPRNLNVVDSVIAEEIFPGPVVSEGLCAKDREKISLLYLEFVDLCGTIDDVKKAWNRHLKLFPDSFRSSSSYENPALVSGLLEIATLEKADNLLHPLGDCISECPSHLQKDDRQPSLTKTHDKLADPVLADQLQSEANNIAEESFHGKTNMLADQGSTDKLQAEVHSVMEKLPEYHEMVDNEAVVNLQLETNHNVQEKLPDSPHTLPEQSGDSSTKSCSGRHRFSGVQGEVDLQEHHDIKDKQEEYDESEHDSQQLCLERLAAGPQPETTLHTSPTKSTEHEEHQRTSLSNGTLLDSDCKTSTCLNRSSTMNALTFDCIGESMSHSPSIGFQSPVPGQTQTLARVSPTVSSRDGRNRYHRSNSNRARRSSNSGSRRRYQEQNTGYHQQLRSRAEMAPQMIVSQPPCGLSQDTHVQEGNPPLNLFQLASAQGAPHNQGAMQNMSQTLASTSQIPPVLPVAYPQQDTSQNPHPSYVQNSQAIEAYNQMWHYYYYQQQLVLQQQQQQSQLQPVQPQLQQLQEQQLMQSSYIQPHQQVQQQRVQSQVQQQEVQSQQVQQQQVQSQQVQQQQVQSQQVQQQEVQSQQVQQQQVQSQQVQQQQVQSQQVQQQQVQSQQIQPQPQQQQVQSQQIQPQPQQQQIQPQPQQQQIQPQPQQQQIQPLPQQQQIQPQPQQQQIQPQPQQQQIQPQPQQQQLQAQHQMLQQYYLQQLHQQQWQSYYYQQQQLFQLQQQLHQQQFESQQMQSQEHMPSQVYHINHAKQQELYQQQQVEQEHCQPQPLDHPEKQEQEKHKQDSPFLREMQNNEDVH